MIHYSVKAQKEFYTDAYPFESRFLQINAGQLHYVDEGEGDPILFVHGTPTWSYLYRDFIKSFSSTHRCIAIDHIGFGLSEKPVGGAGSAKDHSANLLEFIQKLDLKNITLVVHDFGGPIGLGAAIEDADRIKQIVAFNTWLWATKDNPSAQKIDKILNSGIGRFMYLNLNFSPKVLLKKGFSDKKKLSRKAHKAYLYPFPTKESRLSLLQIGQSLLGDSDWYQQQWDRLDVLADKKWLFLWGMEDDFIGPEYLLRWSERLEKAKIHQFDCGHFVQEEASAPSIVALRSFL